MSKPRDKLHNIDGRLFQARMWRQYAYAIKYDAFVPGSGGIGKEWLLVVGRYTYERCVRQARVNVYLARRLNRRSSIDNTAGV